MHFAHPLYLWIAIALGAALIGLFWHLGVARRRALRQLGAWHLIAGLTASVSPWRRRVKASLIVAGVMLLAAALAGPELGVRQEEAHRRGVDVLFAIDTSKSMLTPDVKPNRLERAKLAVRDLVQKFPDDRVGLVAFAGSAFLETPLTLDHGIFEQSLQTLDTNVIPLGGTDVASALDVSVKALAGDEHKKILVLLTDGEELAGDAVTAAEAAAKEGLTVYTVGVGTPGGELVPLPGVAGFVRDENGQPVTSRLDETLLRRIAAATGGSYRALGDNGQGLEALYREELATLPRSDLASRAQLVPIERFQFPLGLGIVLLAVEPFLGERRRVTVRGRSVAAPRTLTLPATRRWRPRWLGASAASAALLLLAPVASASPQSAERAYHDGKFAAAQTDYASSATSSPEDARLQYDLGAAAYRNGDLEAATKSFTAALHTSDLGLQEHAYYNLGDGHYRVGEKTLKDGKTEDTIKTWKQSVSDYEAALHLDPKDADAEYNLDFVKAKLAELEKKNDEHKQKDQQEQQKKDQQQKKDDEQKKGDQPKKDDAQNKGDQPKKDRDQAKNGPPNAPAPAPGDHPEDSAPSKPGELSKGEAKALLDSLRGDLQLRPAATAPPAPAATDDSGKDW